MIRACVWLPWNYHYNDCSSQEEQAGGSSANYDVELIHLAEAHRDILRAGVCVCVCVCVCCNHFEPTSRTLNHNYITYLGLHVHMDYTRLFC